MFRVLVALGAMAAGCDIPEPEPPLQAPRIVRFEVRPLRLSPGAPAELFWSIEGGFEEARITFPDGQGIEVTPPEGSLVVSPRFFANLQGPAFFELEVAAQSGRARARSALEIETAPRLTVQGFSATPTVARANEPIRVSWSTRGASRLVLLADDLELPPDLLNDQGARIVRLRRPARLRLRAEGLGGPLERSVQIVFEEAQPAVQSFFADPTEVEPAGRFSLSWEVIADSVQIFEERPEGDESVLSTDQVSGMRRLIRPPGTYRFRLEARGSGRTARAFASVQVFEEPPGPEIHRLTATPTVTGRGGQARVDWVVRGAEQVFLDLDGQTEGVIPVDGRQFIVGNRDFSIRLTAIGEGEVTRAETQVRVNSLFPVISAFSSVTQTSTSTQLGWSVANADRVRVEDEFGLVLLDALPLSGTREVEPPGPGVLYLIAENPAGQTARGLPFAVEPPNLRAYSSERMTLEFPSQSRILWEVPQRPRPRRWIIQVSDPDGQGCSLDLQLELFAEPGSLLATSPEESRGCPRIGPIWLFPATWQVVLRAGRGRFLKRSGRYQVEFLSRP